MSLHDGVHFWEGVFVCCLAVAAIFIGRYLYKDEQAKIAAIRKQKEQAGKLG